MHYKFICYVDILQMVPLRELLPRHGRARCCCPDTQAHVAPPGHHGQRPHDAQGHAVLPGRLTPSVTDEPSCGRLIAIRDGRAFLHCALVFSSLLLLASVRWRRLGTIGCTGSSDDPVRPRACKLARPGAAAGAAAEDLGRHGEAPMHARRLG